MSSYRPKTYFTETQAKEIKRRNDKVMTEKGKLQSLARSGWHSALYMVTDRLAWALKNVTMVRC